MEAPVPWRGDHATQPTTRIVWPHETAWWGGYVAPGPFVWDVATALRVPAVARATSLYSGLIRQCSLDAYRGIEPLPRPRLLDRPDPTRARSWFVGVQVEDYLWHGNALAQVTSRNAEGWPATVAWLPAATTSIVTTPGEPPRYWQNGRWIEAVDVVHVRRSARRWQPEAGIGVIEQHLGTFDRAALEEEYERTSLTSSGVPSVAIVTPNPLLGQDEADTAKTTWMAKYAGPVREPAILPAGTSVVPLGWSPADSQMVEARKMTLVDIANAFNLDGYWLGAEMKGLTYRSPGPLYLALLRSSLEPVMADFEQGWADAWLPRGQAVRFDRLQLTRDDTATTVETLTRAIAPPQSDPTVPALMTTAEARLYLGLAATPTGPTVASPVDTEEVPA